MKILSRVAALLMASSSIVSADHVNDVITAQMKERKIRGLALAVIDGGKIVREQGYGFCDEGHTAPITPTTLFQAASISKAVTALGALHLVEEGRLSLDEDINFALRSWHIPDNRFTKTHPVTLRLILSHSAGLTVESFPGYRVGSPIPSLLQILDGLPPANTPPVRVNQIPGSKWRYSGGGYLVIQQAMIDVTGRSFADYMQDTVLRPLGMSSSTFAQPLPESLARRAATGFADAPRRAIEGRWRIKPELAAGGLWTTAGDLARFLLAIQRSLAGTSNPVISKSMTRQMLTNQKEDSGLGFFLGGDPPRFGHNGSNHGFDAVAVALCDTGEGAVILMNGNTDIEVLKNILVEAIADQYRWPGYPKTRQAPNTMKPTAPLRENLSESATAPCRGLSLSR